MRIYFAGPLFCEAERAFNLLLVEKLEAEGYQVFLPQRDGIESEKPPYHEMTNDELQQTILSSTEIRFFKLIFFSSCWMVGCLMKVRVLN